MARNQRRVNRRSPQLINHPARVSQSEFPDLADHLLSVGYDQALHDMLLVLRDLAGQNGVDFDATLQAIEDD